MVVMLNLAGCVTRRHACAGAWNLPATVSSPSTTSAAAVSTGSLARSGPAARCASAPTPASTGTVPAQNAAITSAPPGAEPVPAAVATNT